MPELAPELVEEDDGTTKSVAPQWIAITPPLASNAAKAPAKPLGRSTVLSGEPDLLPLDEVFFANSATKPSVKVLMAAVSVVQLEVDDAWLPAVMAEENC